MGEGRKSLQRMLTYKHTYTPVPREKKNHTINMIKLLTFFKGLMDCIIVVGTEHHILSHMIAFVD